MSIEKELEKYVGKVVATRGIGSGVNAGRVVAIEGATIVLTDAYFLRNWKWNNSFGSMDSFSTGDIKAPCEIAKVSEDMIITDLAKFVVCPDDFLKKVKKLSN